MGFDILKTTISAPSCSPKLHNLIIQVINKEKNLMRNQRFRMDEVRAVAQERAYVEKICLKSFPNCISNL